MSTFKITQVATDTILEVHLLCFSEKRSGSASVRGVGNFWAPAPEDAQPNRLCYKMAT